MPGGGGGGDTPGSRLEALGNGSRIAEEEGFEEEHAVQDGGRVAGTGGELDGGSWLESEKFVSGKLPRAD